MDRSSVVIDKGLDRGGVVTNDYGNWDDDYSRSVLTDWEQLPAGDLRDFVSRLGPELRTIRSAAEIGCGRGLRSLVMLATLPGFDRADFQMWGIDQSRVAISAAKWLLDCVNANRSPGTPFHAALEPYLQFRSTPKIVPMTFERADLFSWFDERPAKFDLVIDWMCFHDLSLERREEYAKIVARSCAKYYVMNSFSREGSTVQDLGLVAGVQKFQIGQSEVADLFGQWFEIVECHQFPENLHPFPVPSDGIIAAKRAYIMKRRA